MSFFLLSSPSVFAINASFSCEAGSIGGDLETLKPKVYQNIFPSITINSPQKEVYYSYLKNGMRFETNFKIMDEDDSNLIATYFHDISWSELFYFNKKEKSFSIVYVGDYGNTTDFGQCFD